MSVYEAVRVYKEKNGDSAHWINLPKILRHICCFGLSLLFGLSGFSDGFSPFGVAFCAVVSSRFTVTAALGSVVGYFVSLDSLGALRYTSSVLALAVITLTLRSVKKTLNIPFVRIISSAVCVLTTGLAVTLSKDFHILNLLVNLCEAAICAGSAYVFSKTKTYLTISGGLKTLTSKEITAIVISGCILLLSFRYVNIFTINIADVIALFAVMICSYYGRESGGSIVGVCCGVVRCFGGDLFSLAYYSLGGLVSGALSSFGILASLSAFCVCGMVIYIVSSSTNDVLPIIIETAVSGLIFAVISKKFNSALDSFFTPAVTSPVIDSVKNNIINKLHKASEFSSEICVTLNNVNEVLSKSQKSDTKYIPKRVKESVCFNCGLCDTCWGENREITQKHFDELLELKKQGEYLQYKSVPQSFASTCIRTDNVSSYFNKLFGEYKMHEKTENRIKEIQGLATEQFTNVSGLLLSLCEEINENVRFDIDIASRVKALALSCGLDVFDSFCVCDSFDKMTIELRVKKPCEKSKIDVFYTRFISIANKSFSQPETDEFEDYIRIIYKEKSELKAVSAVVQFNASGEKYSGDSYTTFEAQNGYFYAVICDGMGTGTTAAVTSSLAVNLLEKLIKAGFGIEAAVKTVNTSLISKSGEECSVTLDLLCLDLYTGRVEFYKCGAQNSLLKKHGKITDINISSLPLGIISNVDIGTNTGIVSSGDIIVLCSDGVREEDFYHLRNALKVFNNGNVRNFTTDISETIRRYQPQKNDDFTMITIAVTDNN